jgi:hypothetical protein
MKHINIQMKGLEYYSYFKSAVTFSFLFFLHGFSIGTRQQGISYNALQLYLVADLEAQNLNYSQN